MIGARRGCGGRGRTQRIKDEDGQGDEDKQQGDRDKDTRGQGRLQSDCFQILNTLPVHLLRQVLGAISNHKYS